MGQAISGSNSDTREPGQAVNVHDGIDLTDRPGFSWLTLLLVMGMIVAFGVIWYLSTPQ